PARNRSSVCGQRSLSSRRRSSRRCRGCAGRSAADASNSPRVLAISPRIRAKNSALEVTPALLKRARSHGRQVARLGPLAEEVRQRADAAGADEWPLQRTAESAREAVEPWALQQPR